MSTIPFKLDKDVETLKNQNDLTRSAYVQSLYKRPAHFTTTGLLLGSGFALRSASEQRGGGRTLSAICSVRRMHKASSLPTHNVHATAYHSREDNPAPPTMSPHSPAKAFRQPKGRMGARD